MLAFIVFPILAVLTVAILSRWTSLRQQPLYVLMPLLLSFFIPISTVALVPFDLVNDETVDNRTRLLMWRIIYWVSFALMWLILPVLQAYVESGYHNPLDRIKDALRSTLKYHLIMLAAGIAGLIYMAVSTGLNFTNLKALCVALSHSYGLVLVIWMLGHGCVDIPRNLWHGTVNAKLTKLYMRATVVHDQYSDAQVSYDDVVAKIMALEAIKSSKYGEWIDSLVNDIRSQDMPLSRASTSRAQPRDLTPNNVASLARRYYRELSLVKRSQADWQQLLQDAEYYEDLKSSETPYVNYIRPVLFRGGAVLLGILSVIVTWSEIVADTRLSLVDIIVRKAAPTLRLLLAAGFLGFMCVCVITSLTSMRIFNLYAIVPLQTDASSLLFYAAYSLRLTVPLSYNFLMLNGTQETVFQEFLGKFINLTALGKYFNELLPRLIIIPIVMTLFNFYEIVKDYLGFGLGLDYLADTSDLEGGGAVVAAESEGRGLVRRSLQGFNQSRFDVSAEPPAEESGGLMARVYSLFS